MCQLLDFFFLTTHIVTFHRSHCSLNRKQLNFLPNWILFIFIFIIFHIIFHSVQFSRSFVSDSATPWTAAHQASLSITNSRNLLRLMSIKLIMPSSHLIFYRPLLLLPSVFPSSRIFSSKSVLCIRWPKYWSFSFSIHSIGLAKKRHVYPNVHRSTVYNSQDMEATQMSISR